MIKLPVALQLWSVNNETKQDFASTVKEVAAMGYDGVELAGYGNLDAAGVKAALKAAKLRLSGMHVNPGRLRTELDAVIDEALLLGSSHVICPWWPDSQFVCATACERIGVELATWGAAFRAYNIRFSYHNHDGELKSVEGRHAIDWILGAAAPRDLLMEPDVYWLQMGGLDPVKFLRDQGSRCPLVHLKDEKDLGKGPVAFQPVLETIAKIGAAEWLVVEQEQFDDAPFAAVRRDLKQLRQWLR
jgi:sugar phosphate isomerase/epimerase